MSFSKLRAANEEVAKVTHDEQTGQDLSAWKKVLKSSNPQKVGKS